MDIVSSGIALVLLSPLILTIAILVKLTSPGPAFFKQIRVGKDRREFPLVKFRTMKVNADRTGPLVTVGGDSRITTLGRFLRRTKIDELPELWNVLLGDMSLVGYRPEVPVYIKHYQPEWELVFSLRPGITDLATLQFRNEERILMEAKDVERAYIEVVMPAKMELALYYVDNRSFWLDLKIITLTVWGITLGRFFAKPEDSQAEKAIKQIKSLEL